MLPTYSDFVTNCTLQNQTDVIDSLFEPSGSILRLTLRNKEFMRNAKYDVNTYPEFIELIRLKLLQVSKNTELAGPSSRDVDHLAEIISAHPRLGESSKNLSIHSKNEQKNLKNSQDTPEIQRKLIELNKSYEEVYEGLKFIKFVNGRSRPEIIELMQQRIISGNSWYEETRVAINELCDIAQDRVKKLDQF